jgi:hypothetical protein
MFLHIAINRSIGDIQKEFNLLFPFLRLEFYRADESNLVNPKRFLPEKYMLQYAGHSPKEGDICVYGDMTVSQLEQEFLSLFGLGVQVKRKSGNLWLETTMTDNWTLKKQNEHGKEISV